MSADCHTGFSTQHSYSVVNRSTGRNGGPVHWSLKAFALLLIHVAIVLFVIAVLGLLGPVAIPSIEVAA